ncbi:hypothetical protein [Burkholderia pseudomallei]|uniref:hypothetical protein n=1 Tax=Burkholderia pseudomallei TaxID=28450 RepID=UPI001177EAF0|nr:hypothetical protein [Burkholderia pseudomallei]
MVNIETQWLLRSLIALAKRKLADANANRDGENSWPAGQAWNELGGSSQHAFLRAALEEAGIPHDQYRELIDRATESDVDGVLDAIWSELDSA